MPRQKSNEGSRRIPEAAKRRGLSADSKDVHASCRAFEGLLADVAEAFNNAPTGQFQALMDESLGRIARFLSFDRSSVLLFGPKRNRLQVSYGWADESLPPVPLGRYLEAEVPWYASQIRSGHMLRVETVSDLPPEAEKERRFLLEAGVKSHLSIPLIADGHSIGAAAFGSFHLERRWAPEMVSHFRLIGEVLTLALEEYKASRSLELLSERKDSTEGVPLVLGADNEQLRQLALHLMEAEHHERRQLAETLHESVMQTLAGAGFMMDSARKDLQDSAPEALVRATELVRSAIRDLRVLVLDLLPQSLYEIGLGAALRWLAEQVSSVHGMEVEVDLDSANAPLGEDLRLLLYEAARGLLSNAAVHGRAGKATVELRRTPSADLQLTVSDNGSGFDADRLEDIPSKSFGLFALREQAQLLGGSLKISSTQGRGTRVTVTLPYGNRSSES